VNESPIEAVMNLYGAALLVMVYDDPGEPMPPVSRITARVDSSWFESNERGASLVGSFASASVTDCTFVGNAAMHAGAGLLVFIDPSNPAVNVTGCRFIGNAAGFVNNDAYAAYADSFRVHDDEVRDVLGFRKIQSSTCTKLNLSSTTDTGFFEIYYNHHVALKS